MLLDCRLNPPSLIYNGYLGLFPGVKRPGREADHSLPASAEVKEWWSYTCIPPVRLHGVVLNLKNAQGQLYLLMLG